MDHIHHNGETPIPYSQAPSMIHPSHRRDAIQAAVPVVMSFLAIMLLWVSPIPAAIKGWANYLPLHMALETIAIFFAGMIFSLRIKYLVQFSLLPFDSVGQAFRRNSGFLRNSTTYVRTKGNRYLL